MSRLIRFPYGKGILLTGGSSGIGLSCAALLSESGYTVYSASRNPQTKITYAPGGGKIIPVKMDIRDAPSAENAVRNILRESDIGIVIHNAGIGIAASAESFPEEKIHDLMDTNFFAVMRLNSLLLPHFRKRGNGLCIFVSSIAALFPIPFQSHYCCSKSALEAYAGALRMELSDYSVRVALVLPGDTNTGFTGARTFEIENDSPYYESCIKAVSKMEKDEMAGRPPDSVANVVSKLCEKNNPPLRNIVGFDYKILAFLRRLLPARLIEYMLKKLYMG